MSAARISDLVVYKICPAASWSEALQHGELPVSRDDRRDGYVHLSAAHQVRGTLERHFAGQAELVLLELPVQRLPPHALRWEPGRNGEPFPHLYTALRAEFVARVIEAPLTPSGHQLPDGF